MKKTVTKSSITERDKFVTFSHNEKNLKFTASVELLGKCSYAKPDTSYEVSVKNHWLFGKDWRVLFAADTGLPSDWIKDIDRKLKDLIKLKKLLVEMNGQYKKFKKTYKPKEEPMSHTQYYYHGSHPTTALHGNSMIDDDGWYD